jgi:hypothetical protein
MKRVSVVIPNYNGIAFLPDCLRSLKKQTYRDFCVIIVDNGSTDGSISFIEKNYPEVKLISLGENTGFAKASNVGINAADSEYVFLLNNDTICDEKAIEKLVSTMDTGRNIFSVQAKMLQLKKPELVDDAGDYYCALGWAFAPSKDKPSDKYSRRLELTSACAGAAIYRKSMLEETGLFDEAHFCYLEDVDLGYRGRLLGYRNVLEPGAIVYHAGSASSGSRHNAFKVELTAANNLYLIYKNMPALQVIINLPLILIGIVIKQIFYVKKGLGGAHVKGLLRGFSKIFSNSGKKVRFGKKQALNSLKMQLELWINCIRRIGIV